MSSDDISGPSHRGPSRRGPKSRMDESGRKVLRLLKANPTMADAEIAKSAKCRPSVVARIRRKHAPVSAPGSASTDPDVLDPTLSSPTDPGPEALSTRAALAAAGGEAEIDPENPPLTPFMPNAREAEALAEQMRGWKARLVALRTDIRKAFPDRNAVMSKRVDAGATDAALTELIETIDKNIPEHVCPACCGTGTDEAGQTDKYCDGYGVIDRHHHGGLKARWKQSLTRYSKLSAGEAGE